MERTVSGETRSASPATLRKSVCCTRDLGAADFRCRLRPAAADIGGEGPVSASDRGVLRSWFAAESACPVDCSRQVAVTDEKMFAYTSPQDGR